VKKGKALCLHVRVPAGGLPFERQREGTPNRRVVAIEKRSILLRSEFPLMGDMRKQKGKKKKAILICWPAG